MAGRTTKLYMKVVSIIMYRQCNFVVRCCNGWRTNCIRLGIGNKIALQGEKSSNFSHLLPGCSHFGWYPHVGGGGGGGKGGAVCLAMARWSQKVRPQIVNANQTWEEKNEVARVERMTKVPLCWRRSAFKAKESNTTVGMPHGNVWDWILPSWTAEIFRSSYSVPWTFSHVHHHIMLIHRYFQNRLIALFLQILIPIPVWTSVEVGPATRLLTKALLLPTSVWEYLYMHGHYS